MILALQKLLWNHLKTIQFIGLEKYPFGGSKQGKLSFKTCWNLRSNLWTVTYCCRQSNKAVDSAKCTASQREVKNTSAVNSLILIHSIRCQQFTSSIDRDLTYLKNLTFDKTLSTVSEKNLLTTLEKPCWQSKWGTVDNSIESSVQQNSGKLLSTVSLWSCREPKLSLVKNLKEHKFKYILRIFLWKYTNRRMCLCDSFELYSLY